MDTNQEIEDLTLDDFELAISNEWKFDWRKCWKIPKLCAWAKGRAALFGGGTKYEIQVSGEVGADRVGRVTFSKRVPLAQKCVRIPLKDIGSIQVCVENLDLKKKRFKLVLKACIEFPLIGTKCVTVYEKDIVIAAVSELQKFAGVEVASLLSGSASEYAFEVIEVHDSGDPGADEAVQSCSFE